MRNKRVGMSLQDHSFDQEILYDRPRYVRPIVSVYYQMVQWYHVVKVPSWSHAPSDKLLYAVLRREDIRRSNFLEHHLN